MQHLDSDSWDYLFDDCRASAFHLEVRDAYAVPSESEEFRRFLDGEPPGDYDKRDWINLVENATARGVVMSRVRVVTVPHSDYQRWLFTVTVSNVAAGEDIRYLPRDQVDPDEVPSDDWWLFDDSIVAFNLVNELGRPAGVAVTRDRETVGHCIAVKERLMALAIPFGEYWNKNQT